MKVSEQNRVRPVVSAAYLLSEGAGPSGQVLVSNGSNSLAWGSNVANIWANGSNKLIGPEINLASGSNIIFTLDQGPGGSSPSNTLRIHSTGGGSSSLTVADEGTPLATAATTLDFVGAGVTASGTGATKTITISGSAGSSSPFDGKPYIWTPPSSAASQDDEFNDGTSMSGPVNGLNAKWTKRNLGTASWFVLNDSVAPGCAYFDIPTGQASDQGIYQTVPAGDWTFAAHFHGHRASDRQYWGIFCVSSAGTGVMAVLDSAADGAGGVRTLTTWADGGAGTFHGEVSWNADENSLNRNPSNPVTITLRKASGVYHMGYSYSHRLLPGNYFEVSHTPTSFTAAFIGFGRFGPSGTAGVSKVTLDFFRKVA